MQTTQTRRDKLLAGFAVRPSVLRGSARPPAAVPPLLSDTTRHGEPTTGPKVARSRLRRRCDQPRVVGTHEGGTVAGVVGMDCAPPTQTPTTSSAGTLTPSPGERLRFICHDFSNGLNRITDGEFDAVVSGLSISYAESSDPISERLDNRSLRPSSAKCAECCVRQCVCVFGERTGAVVGQGARHSLFAALAPFARCDAPATSGRVILC